MELRSRGVKTTLCIDRTLLSHHPSSPTCTCVCDYDFTIGSKVGHPNKPMTRMQPRTKPMCFPFFLYSLHVSNPLLVLHIGLCAAREDNHICINHFCNTNLSIIITHIINYDTLNRVYTSTVISSHPFPTPLTPSSAEPVPSHYPLSTTLPLLVSITISESKKKK